MQTECDNSPMCPGRETTMTTLLSVTTKDGKYTVTQEQGGRVRLLRHGEPWPAGEMAYVGSGLVLALAYELEAARAALRFYADPASRVPEDDTPLNRDGGRRAREALGVES